MAELDEQKMHMLICGTWLSSLSHKAYFDSQILVLLFLKPLHGVHFEACTWNVVKNDPMIFGPYANGSRETNQPRRMPN